VRGSIYVLTASLNVHLADDSLREGLEVDARRGPGRLGRLGQLGVELAHLRQARDHRLVRLDARVLVEEGRVDPWKAAVGGQWGRI
jgi:hypothetical protein